MQDATSTKLTQELENNVELTLKWLRDVLSLAIDVDNSALLRSQAAAAGITLNAQLRADALRLKAAHHDNALETLMKMIREKEATVPRKEIESRSQPLGSLGA